MGIMGQTLTDEETKVISLFRKLDTKDKDKIEGMLELKVTEHEGIKKVILFTCQTGKSYIDKLAA